MGAVKMPYHGYAYIVRATNATHPEIIAQTKPGALTDAAAPTSTTYQSTGIQTHPPRDAPQFQKIFGRRPVLPVMSAVTEVGTGAIGRYETTGGAFTYEHAYGRPFAAAAASDTKGIYTDSGFQTQGYFDALRCLTKAKVKASIMVNRYRKVAEEAGVRVSVEAKTELVIHSEQFPSTVRLDAEGNIDNGDLSTVFLPNIYGDEIPPPVHTQSLALSPSPDSKSGKKSPTNNQAQHRIPSLAPSLRNDVPDPQPIEDYGEEYNESRWTAEYKKRFLANGARGDGVPPPAFIIYDPITAENTTNTLSSSKRKRDDANEDRRPSPPPPSKRTKLSPSSKRNKVNTTHLKHKLDRELDEMRRHQNDERAPHTPITAVSDRTAVAANMANIPRGPRSDRNRISTPPPPRMPRDARRGQRDRSRSPAPRDTKSYRARESSTDIKTISPALAPAPLTVTAPRASPSTPRIPIPSRHTPGHTFAAKDAGVRKVGGVRRKGEVGARVRPGRDAKSLIHSWLGG